MVPRRIKTHICRKADSRERPAQTTRPTSSIRRRWWVFSFRAARTNDQASHDRCSTGRPPTMPKLARLPDRIRPLDPPKDRGWGAEWRGSSTQRGYGWEWQKLRNRVLARDAGLCQPCLRRGHVTPGCRTVDHITPKARGGGDHEGNCQVICDECHKAKTAAEARGSTWDESLPDRAA